MNESTIRPADERPQAPISLASLQALYADAGLTLELSEQAPTPAGPIYAAWIAGGDGAIAIWEKLRALTETSGYWPILRGARMSRLDWADVTLPEAWLEQARSIDAEAWFIARQADSGDINGEALGLIDEWAEFAGEVKASELGKAASLTSYFTPFDILTGEPHPRLWLNLIPTRRGFEAAAYLGFGGFNPCPEPATQVALQRYWQLHYGAEPVAMTSDVLEMRVTRPPLDESAAAALARQHFLFCGDIVLQGVMSLENLKNTLKGSPLWYFWWDVGIGVRGEKG